MNTRGEKPALSLRRFPKEPTQNVRSHFAGPQTNAVLERIERHALKAMVRKQRGQRSPIEMMQVLVGQQHHDDIASFDGERVRRPDASYPNKIPATTTATIMSEPESPTSRRSSLTARPSPWRHSACPGR